MHSIIKKYKSGKQKLKKRVYGSSSATKTTENSASESTGGANTPNNGTVSSLAASDIQEAAEPAPTASSSSTGPAVSPSNNPTTELLPSVQSLSKRIPSDLQKAVEPPPTASDGSGNSQQKPLSYWKEAFDKLTDEQRRNLQVSDPTGSVEAELAEVQKTKEKCIDGQRTITLPGGKIIVIRDKIQGILKKMQQYIVIGDIAIQHHPDTVALVWAGVRFCMQVVLDDMETFEAVVSFLEEIANIIGSCRIYENLFSPGDLESTGRVMKGLLLLYIDVLGFIAEANVYFEAATGRRIAKAITNPFVLRFDPMIKGINERRKDLDESARIAHMDVQKQKTQEQLQEFQKLNDQLSIFQADIVQIHDGLAKLLLHVEAEERAKILQWLSPVMVRDHREGLRKIRFKGTGEWLPAKPGYKSWIDSNLSSVLWLRGKAGSGKSVLSSFITDALEGTQEESVPVIFFYCNYKEEARKEASSILRSLLKQLLAWFPKLHQDLVASYKKATAEGHNQSSLDSYTTEALLRVTLSQFKTVFIVIDALDECHPEERKILVKFLLDQVESTNGCSTKIFFASRDEKDLRQIFKGKHIGKYIINSDDTEKDIRPFVKHEVESCMESGALLSGNVSAELQREIITSLVDNADGMFLWVRYQLLQLRDAANQHDLIARLQKPSQGLEAMYKEIWEKISLLDEAQRNWAYRTISWILYATEPLSPACLLEATAIEPSDTATFDGSRKASDVGYLIQVCKHLIVEDAQGRIRFMHYSVQEFVKNQSEVGQLKGLTVEACLITLSRPPEADLYTNSEYPFYDHATQNWEKYLRGLDSSKMFGRAMERFLLDKTVHMRWVKRRLDMDYGFRREAKKYSLLSSSSHILNPTIVAIYFNLRELVKHLLEAQPETYKYVGPDTWQLLHLAVVWEEHVDLVKILLEAGADVNAQGGGYGNALQAAAQNRSVEVVRVLLEAGADVNAQGGYCGNALQAAIRSGSVEVVRVLLEAGADANAQGGDYGNALQAAIQSGSVEVVRVLLEAGADANAQGGDYGNALRAAAQNRSVEVVMVLLEAGVDVNAQGGDYGNALQAAAQSGSVEVVKILLEAGADVNAQGGYYENALQAAARSGCVDVVKILLEAGADVNALQAAAQSGSVEAVRVLLEAGADVNAQGGDYGNTLYAAARMESVEMVRVLLEAGADVNAQGGYYGNALQEAAQSGSIEVVRVLLEAGADVNAQGGGYGNALQAAAQSGSVEVVRVLLEAGADVNAQGGDYGNAQGGDYGNALQAAAQSGSVEAVRVLLEAGADVNAQGGYYGNALYAAARMESVEVVMVLLEAGADVNVQGGYCGNALQEAAQSGSVEVVRVLLEAGADANAQGGEHGNALYAAAWCESVKVVRALLEAGADVNAQGGEYGNALQVAAQSGSVNVVKILLQAGADVNAQRRYYGNALQAAVRSGSVEVVRVLLKAGADVNAQGGMYGNALQTAARSGSVDVVRILLEAGADVNAQGGYYGNALKAAISDQNEVIAELLVQAGAIRSEYHSDSLPSLPLETIGPEEDRTIAPA